MNEIIILDIKFKFGEVEDEIHPVVLKDELNMVLIDCGYTGFLETIEQAMNEKNLFCSDLTHVLITHHDHDHMGSLFDLKQKYPKIKIVASKIEAPYISGQLKSLRLEQAEQMQQNLSDEQKTFALKFCNILKNVKPVKVDMEVSDGDVFNWCGGCSIIGTPGHTPGHISVYVNNNKTLIVGDAATIENGKLVIANPQFTLNIKDAETSLNKIRAYGAKKIVCYHGGIFIV